ncbi:hypothetical protein IWQ61_008875, partial [Dispira simplex]
MATSFEKSYISLSVMSLLVAHFFLRWVSGRILVYVIGLLALVLCGQQLYIYWQQYQWKRWAAVFRLPPSSPVPNTPSKRKRAADEEQPLLQETAGSSQDPGGSSLRGDERTTTYATVASPTRPTADHPTPPTVPFSTPGLRACKSVLTLLNILAVMFVLDFAFVPYFFHEAYDVTFMRVGALYPDGAKILVRDPDAAKVKLWVAPLNIPHDVVRQAVYDQILPSTLEGDIGADTISTRDSLVWQLWLETEPTVTPDFTYVLRLTHLDPHTHYVVRGV